MVGVKDVDCVEPATMPVGCAWGAPGARLSCARISAAGVCWSGRQDSGAWALSIAFCKVTSP